jgi:class 3 adenylate cyclase/tetratricopeptide (TPR) repeat protein
MNCPRCQHETPSNAAFCPECGASLAAVCVGCGTTNAPTHKFCTKCGQRLALKTGAGRPRPATPPEVYTPKHLAEKILTSKAALEGERKQVTVLFADLKGSMELLADRDPEEARQILDPVLELMMEAVHRYEGTVNQVMGDGIMALFGAPLAHEDHAVRACHAALRMQESVKRHAEDLVRSQGVSVQIRVGLNCGDVVVRSIGSDLHMDYTAVGQTTHLAARMEQLAPAGSIYATTAIVRFAAGQVAARAIGPTPIKGLRSPAEVWEITDAGPATPRFEISGPQARTPFVGRDEPMRQLVNPLGRAQRGEGQVVAVVGEAGIGKSRLFWEFLHRHVTSDVVLLRGRSVSFGKATPYLPVVDLLKSALQIEEADSPAAIAARVRATLATLDSALQADVPALLAVLGVPSDDRQWEQFDPPQRRQGVLDALRRLLLRIARDRAVVLVVEDLHWIDDGTQDVLDTFVDALPGVSILLLVSYRPEYRHGWSGKPFYAEVRLDPFQAEVSADLLDSLLGADSTLADLKRTLVAQTQGNPFFLEESVRHLAETGVLAGAPGAYRVVRSGVRIEIPATVQGVLAARIDRLSPDDKRLLQVAAVVGKDIPLGVLEAVADLHGSKLSRALARLQDTELLRVVRPSPDLLYTFKHALTHEVTYGSLLSDRKKLLHGRVLEAIEHLHSTRLTEHAEALARHAIRGEVWEKAVDYLREAGTKAYARGALADAAARAMEALDLGRHLSQSPANIRRRIDAMLDLHAPLFAGGQFRQLISIMEEAEALARELNDPARLGRALNWLGSYRYVQAQYADYRDYARQALAISEGAGDAEVRLIATSQLGFASHALGDYAAAIAHFEWVVTGPDAELAKRRFGAHASPYVTSSAWLTWSYAVVGGFPQAFAHAHRCMGAAGSTSPVVQAMAHIFTSFAFVYRGDFDRACSDAEAAMRLCETHGVLTWLSASYAAVGSALSHSGRASDGLPYLERAVNVHEATGYKLYLTLMYRLWAEGLLLGGEPGPATEKAEHALSLARAFGERGEEAQTLLLLADIATRRGEMNEATKLYTSTSTFAAELGMRPLVAHCALGVGRLYRCAGKREPATEHLTTATGMYRDMGMTYWLEKAEAEMRQLA